MPNDPVAQLLDERACERLIVDYTHLVDFGEAARIAELFTRDGVWEADGVRMVGQAAIRAGFLARHGVARRTSRHVCSNVAITLRGPNEATGLSYLVNYRHDSPRGTGVRAPAPHGRLIAHPAPEIAAFLRPFPAGCSPPPAARSDSETYV